MTFAPVDWYLLFNYWRIDSSELPKRLLPNIDKGLAKTLGIELIPEIQVQAWNEK